MANTWLLDTRFPSKPAQLWLRHHRTACETLASRSPCLVRSGVNRRVHAGHLVCYSGTASARGSLLIVEESSEQLGRFPPGAQAPAAQRAYMHAIRRLHAIRDLEHKHLAVTSSWSTEAARWLSEAARQVAQACTLWRGAIHGVEARHGTGATLLECTMFPIYIPNTGSQVAQSFYLLRACRMLNALLTALWLALVVIPTAVHPPSTTNWRMFLSRRAWGKIWQGDGLDTSILLHGMLPDVRVDNGGIAPAQGGMEAQVPPHLPPCPCCTRLHLLPHTL